MTLIDDVRKNTPTSPFYAAVGMTDLAVEKVRDARVRAEKVATSLRADLEPATVQAKATEVVGQAKELPTRALNETLVVAGKVAERYDVLAQRGHQLVAKLRNQKATKDLIAQAETTVAAAKGSVTTARKAVADVERSAKATLTTGRKEAEKVVEVVTTSVEREAKLASEQVVESLKKTRTAAKRTATTTRNAATKTTTSAKSVRTGARKTAVATKKAAVKGAEKVG